MASPRIPDAIALRLRGRWGACVLPLDCFASLAMTALRLSDARKSATSCPGRGAARSGAPLIRDRQSTCLSGPGSAAHHCAALRAALRPGLVARSPDGAKRNPGSRSPLQGQSYEPAIQQGEIAIRANRAITNQRLLGHPRATTKADRTPNTQEAFADALIISLLYGHTWETLLNEAVLEYIWDQP